MGQNTLWPDLFVAGIIFLFVLDNTLYARKARTWVETPAEVLLCRSRGEDQVLLHLAYEFRGTQQKIGLNTFGVTNDFVVGRKIILLVNPEKPDQCVVRRWPSAHTR